MVTSGVQYLLTLVCAVLVTPQSYTSLKSVLLNYSRVQALPEKCLPKCENSNGDTLSSTHVRDPSSCDQYWVCLQDGTLYNQPHRCRENEIVNLVDLVCEPKVNDGSDQCTIPDPDCDPSIPKVCYHKDSCPPPEDGIFGYADEDDCTIYHICNFGDADIICGDPGAPMYFNGQECVADPKECCNCQALCTTTWTTIPDPTDTTCQNYYLCQGLDSSVSGCMTSMECETAGYFPRCKNVCDGGFFICSGSSVNEKATVEPEFCMGDQVFDASSSRCMPPDFCHSVGYIASEEEKFKCPGVEKYDESTGQCSAESVDCNPTCASSPLTTPSPFIETATN